MSTIGIEMSSRIGNELNFLSNDFQQMFEVLRAPSSLEEKRVLERVNSVLNNYTLTSDASLARKFRYFFFRLWDAVKAFFGSQTDWHCIKKDLMDLCVTRINASKLFDLLGDERSLITDTIDATIDAWFMIKVDNRWDQCYKQKNHVYLNYILIQSPYGMKQYLLECADKLKFDKKIAEDLFVLIPPIPGKCEDEMLQINTESLKELGTQLLKERKTEELSQLINQVSEVVNEINERSQNSSRLDLYQPETGSAIRKATDLQTKVLHCLASKSFIHKIMELGKKLLFP